MTGPKAETVLQVGLRDAWACARCGRTVAGERGRDWSVHHRTPRQIGVSRAGWINRPSNLVLLCGSGVTGCHGLAERNRWDAEHAGLIVRRGEKLPAEVPVEHAAHGWCVMDDEGGWSPSVETREEAWS